MTASLANGQSGFRPRLSDVAKLAGVSLGAASKALSNPAAVRKTTLHAVHLAVERLGYVPCGNARALASGRSMTIGVVLPTISNPIFASFVHALQRCLHSWNYHLLVAAHEYDAEAEQKIVGGLAGQGVDGLILIGTDHPAAVPELLNLLRIPFLYSWSTDEAGEVGCIGFSNRQAMFQIVDHLADLGHQEIAFLSGNPTDNERARIRLEAVQERCGDRGVSLPTENIEIVSFSLDGGKAGLRRLIAGQRKFTALIGATDLIAAGAMAAARAEGISIPAELSITGVDDIELASIMAPPLTTVRTPIAEMAEMLGRAMVERIGDRRVTVSHSLPTQLIIRASTGTPGIAGSFLRSSAIVLT